MLLPLGAIQLASGQETTCPDGTVVPVGTACPGGTPPPVSCTCPDGFYSVDCNCAGHDTPYTPPPATTEYDCGNACMSCGGSCSCCPTTAPSGACVACPDGFYPNYATDPTCSCTGHQGTTTTTPAGAGGGCQCSCGWSPSCTCASMCPSYEGYVSPGYIPPASICPSPEYRCGDGSCSAGSKCGCYCGGGMWAPDCNCGTSGTAASCGPAEYRCGNGACSMNGMCGSMVSGGDGCPGCDQYGPGYHCGGRWIPSCGGALPMGGMNCGDCPKCDYGNIGYDCHGCWVPSCASMATTTPTIGTAACGPCKDCAWPDMWGRCPESMMATTQAGGGCSCYDGTNRERCEMCPVPPPGWVPPSNFKPAMPMRLYDQYGRPIYEQIAQPQPPQMMMQPMMMPRPVYNYEFKCPDMAQGEQKCMEAKGKPISKLDPHGCPFIECDFMGMAQTGSGFMRTQMMTSCPLPEEMTSVKDKCGSLGMKAVVERMGDCNFVKCAGMGLAENYCPRGPLPGPEREACEAEGKQIIMQVSENGCPVQKCIAAAEAEQFCQKEADIQGAFKECTEKQGGEPAVKYSDEGCVEFYECVVRGDESQVEFEEVTEVPDAAKILSAVLAMEKLKIQFNELSKEIQGIADYYE